MGDNIDQKIKNLIKDLNFHTKMYDEGRPMISDKEWDDMYFKLIKLENESNIYYKDSPTQKINYQVMNKLNKVEHSHPMLSLDKTKSIDDVKSFIGKRRYICMAKMDGLTCSLTYCGGRLVKAETRGNGLIGEDILHNALVVKNIPNKIDYQDELIIDGEIICDYNSFKSFSEEYKNPRNFASGSIRLLDSKECEQRKLSFIAWDLITDLKEEYLSTKLDRIKELGFTIVPFYWGDFIDDGVLETTIENIKIWCKEQAYPIDGVVFKYDNIKEYEAVGRTDHHFKGGIAYKFYDEEYETILKDIEWTMGRTGILTPVAIYEDIDIDGSTCNRASLHNISIMKELLGGYGWENQKISIFKANQIIPQIAKAESDDEYVKKYFHYPMTCPICGGNTSIHKDNDSEVLYCDNPNCEGKLINRIDHFCSKKGLDIKGLSKATLEKLLDWGYIGDIQSIFELKEFRDEWIKKPGFGVKSVDNILEAIEKAKNTTLDKIIAAAGIPEIGSRVGKDLASHYDSWNDFRSETNFLQYDGIGEVMNNNLLSFDYTEMDYIVEHYLKTEKNIDIINIENNLIKDKIFCVTGKTHIFKNRAELTADIESKGGKVVSAISSKVNYLINNDINSTSAKNKAAQAANIPILTEEDYIALNLKK